MMRAIQRDEAPSYYFLHYEITPSSLPSPPMGAKVSEHGAPSVLLPHGGEGVRRTVEGDWVVRNLLLVPHFAFPPSAIIKRPPLSSTARRAGWVGCNFALNRIPADARIEIVTTVIEKGRAVSPLTAEDLTFLRPAGTAGPTFRADTNGRAVSPPHACADRRNLTFLRPAGTAGPTACLPLISANSRHSRINHPLPRRMGDATFTPKSCRHPIPHTTWRFAIGFAP